MHVSIFSYIKNFAWEDQKRKQCYIVHIAQWGVNSAILFIYRTRYAYGKEPEGFQKVFSTLSVLDPWDEMLEQNYFCLDSL